ncbi:hypothetical protein D3OALGA1CA_3127 [Olavius algarvensis associated proteobacterium Delta 3]|nr:hypothetical protein D3OALGA1CA_3127 [Olavius algarvensis associated proteobacterium Delta 3]CAB5159041.1 hypothetical protein D3OALGB2SA_5309 [Olavius algarvensis associated proteobacterium Delta 3]
MFNRFYGCPRRRFKPEIPPLAGLPGTNRTLLNNKGSSGCQEKIEAL